ncbi:SCO4402 family protein [Paracidovorax avenae]|uniref:SCO4402 family protein n=1 Tax=Paracidovorax avenae TaxID=80867 RepID=UPI001AD81679|nr:hypothetical protein [Paracidovorax avenae]
MGKSYFKYPFLRRELLMCMQALADRDYQNSAWISRIFPPGIEWDSLGVAVDFIFNDSGLSDDAVGAIGIFLVEDELGGVAKVIEKMEVVFEKYGDDCSDLEYISQPEWSDVVESATVLLDQIKNNNRNLGFDPSMVD